MNYYLKLICIGILFLNSFHKKVWCTPDNNAFNDYRAKLKTENNPHHDYFVHSPVIKFDGSTHLGLSQEYKLFTGDIFDDEIKNEFMQLGVKILEPFTFDDTELNRQVCIDRIRWLEKYYYAKRYHIEPKFPVTLVKGEAIGLKCPFCEGIELEKPKIWFKKRLFESETGTLDEKSTTDTYYEEIIGDMHNMESDNHITITRDHTLMIKNFQPNDIGTYICINTETYREIKDANVRDLKRVLAKYFGSENLNDFDERFHEKLNLFSASSNDKQKQTILIDLIFKISYHVFITEKISEQERDVIVKNETMEIRKIDPQTGLEFFVQWQAWGYCSHCNQTGTKKRLGDCRVRYNNSMNTGTRNNALAHMNKLYFPFGWPCRFNLHEGFIGDEFLKNVSYDLVHYSYCYLTCTELDNEKTAKETAQLLSKDFKNKQKRGLNYAEEDKRRTHKVINVDLYEIEGVDIELHCPHTNLESNVIWRKNSQRMDLALYDSKSKERHHITALNVYHIKKIKTIDAGYYDCIVGPFTHAVFFINVAEKPKLLVDEELSGKYPVYHIAFQIWFSFFSILVFITLVIKCMRYQQFLGSLKKRRKIERMFNNNIGKYIQINMKQLVENFNYDGESCVDENDGLEYEDEGEENGKNKLYNHEKDGVITDKIYVKMKLLKK